MLRHTALLVLSFTLNICAGSTNVFPYMEFFGLKGEPSTHMKKMLDMYYLCSSSSKQTDMMQCECSHNCMKFNSCCMDALWESDRNETMEQYKTRLLLEAEKYAILQCNPILTGLPKAHGYSVESVLMRSTCQKSVEQSLVNNCETAIGRQAYRPVLGIDGYIYKNKYCAICNDNAEFRRMNISAKDCNEDRTLPNTTSFFQQNRDCKFELESLTDPTIQDDDVLRICQPNPEVTCEPTTTETHCRLCSGYLSGFKYNGTCYKNFHCFMIMNSEQNLERISKAMFFECGDYKVRTRSSQTTDLGDGLFGWSFSIKPSYSMLVSFNDLSETQCEEGEIYDDVSKQCIVDVVCGPGYTQIGTSCKKSGIISHDITGMLSSRYSEQNSLCLSDVVFVTVNLSKFDDTENITNTIETVMSGGKILHRSGETITFQIKTNKTTTHLLDSSIYNVKSEVRSTVPDQYITELYGIDFTRTFPGDKLCAFPIIHENVNLNTTDNCELRLNDTILSPNDYVINIYAEQSRDSTHLITCKKFHLQSSCLKRTISTFQHIPNNGNIMVDGTMFEPGEYIPMETGVAVCISSPTTMRVKGWERVVNGVDHYITVVGCSCSIVCYIWVMLTYTIIPALKTIPGKNIVCLCFTLMFCDILLLCGTANLKYQICAAFGVLLHYFALSAQFWAGIVAFDIWSTFNSRSMIKDIKTGKRFKLYLIFGFFFPAGLMVIFAVLEFTKKVNFGYGLNGICWITKFYPRLATYIIPMTVITALNITALSYTIYCIYKHAKKSKKLLKKSGGESMSLSRMSLKLIILLGAIEILGLVQTDGNSSDDVKIFNGVFRIIYSSVRAFRGVFIWLLYIVTDRVFNVYRDIKSQRSLYTRSSTLSQSSHERYNRESKRKLMETSCST